KIAQVQLRVRCTQLPAQPIKVMKEIEPRGIAKDETGVPRIFVVESGDNMRKKKDKALVWGANPQELRKYVTATKEMVKAAAGGFAIATPQKKRWFGAEAKEGQWSTIGEKLKKLDTYLTETLGTVLFACTDGNDIASINRKSYQNKEPADVTVLLGRGFHWNRYSDGEIICSIVHEFTHILCGTEDETVGKEEQYGLTKCLTLAADHPDQARQNADNWSYFIAEFKDKVTNHAAIDWRYLDNASFNKRSPLEKGDEPPY
ncbi:MAG TPA: M35 family metallo-endopeptidase, partial [Candidatus Methylomirabilis sp.]|nr:M35 family metallo-endopeptidase [Candidatus Methylomirabilis sp.]